MKKKIFTSILATGIIVSMLSSLTASAVVETNSNYDFRNINWEMSAADVLKSEKQIPSVQSQYGVIYDNISYPGSKLCYCFVNGVCDSASIAFPTNYTVNDLLQDYTNAYGQPIDNGFVYVWNIKNTQIILSTAADNTGVQCPFIAYRYKNS